MITLQLKNTLGILKQFGKDLELLYKQGLDDKGINASYALDKSVDVVVYIPTERNNYQLIFKALDYYKDVENGQKAGTMVEYKNILKWIQVKPVIPRAGNSITKQKGLAAIIKRKIFEDGTRLINGKQGYHLLEECMEDLIIKYEPLIQGAFLKDVDILSINILNKIK